MSLTNPNKVITEQRLNEYHNTILPYLGGMPEMVANKFSRGDIYSTSEKMIGQWIDGKPLYQKVIDATSYNLVSQGSITIQTGLTTVDNLISIEGLLWHDGGQYWRGIPNVQDNSPNQNSTPFNFMKTDGSIKVFTRNSSNASDFSLSYIILRYTKTTDSAISIGTDTDYSTTEKIIGTWIDGKPLYQKTIQMQTANAVSTWSRENIGTSIDYAQLVNASLNNGTGSFITLNGFNSGFTTGISCTILNNQHYSAPNTIALITTESAWLEKNVYVTLQYTKTTD